MSFPQPMNEHNGFSLVDGYPPVFLSTLLVLRYHDLFGHIPVEIIVQGRGGTHDT